MTAWKLSLAGGLALLAGVALMAALHGAAWFPANLTGAGLMAMHHGMGMPHGMPWFMALGPLAMMLTLAGVVLLLASVLRRTTKAG